MFGFGLGKLLFTVFVIGAVWYGFKWIGRLQDRSGAGGRVGKAGASRSEAPQPLEAQYMVPCPVCGDYVVADAAGTTVDCPHADCPNIC